MHFDVNFAEHCSTTYGLPALFMSATVDLCIFRLVLSKVKTLDRMDLNANSFDKVII
jgi:hypothetical protein